MRTVLFAWPALRIAAIVLTAAIAPTTLAAAPLPLPARVADFAPGSAAWGVNPARLTPGGDKLFFAGSDPRHGYEPWVSDGNAAGTRRLADLCPGPCSSHPSFFRLVGEKLVVIAGGAAGVYSIDPAGGAETLFRDHRAIVTGLAQLGDVVYFQVGDPASGAIEVYQSDGTRAGTGPATGLCAGSPCRISGLEEADGALLFVRDGQLFRQPAQGLATALAAMDSFSASASLAGGLRVFRGCVGALCQIYGTDGTAAGTRQLSSWPAGVAAKALREWRGRAYFVLGDGRVASTDGMPAGTRIENAVEGADPELLAADDQHLFYSSAAPPWRDLRALDASGAGSLPLVRSSDRIEIVGLVAGRLYFTYFEPPFRRILASSGGNPASTLSFGEVRRAGAGARLGALLYFGLELSADSGGARLWRTGDDAGLVELGLGETPRSSHPLPFRVGDALITVHQSREVFRIDPWTFVATPLSDDPIWAELRAGRSRLYLKSEEVFGSGLATVGAAGGLEWLAWGAGPLGLDDEDRLYFSDTSPGQELFETDGSPAGTRELFDLLPGWDACAENRCGELPRAITPSGERIFFIAAGSAPPGEALWVFRHGAAAERLADLRNPVASLVAIAPGRVVFTQRLEATGQVELWSSDGSAAGTRKFTTLPPEYESVSLVAAGERLFFTAAVGPDTILAAADPALGAIQLLVGAPGTRIDELIASGDRVYWSGARDRGALPELGVSAGAPENTRWLELGAAWVQNLGPAGDGRVVFAASRADTGLEPWISDGSAAGSRLLADVAPGPESSAPSHFARVGQRIFFAADGDGAGRELWALDLADPPCPADRLCLRGDRFEVAATAIADGRRFAARRALADDGSGVLSFFSPDNWELLVKVLDGCASNQAFWVYAAAASDQPWELEVHDRWSGAVRRYQVPAGAQGPILDGGAFASCAAAPLPPVHAPAAPPDLPAAFCPGDADHLCLGPQGRYRVKLDWRTATGAGEARPVPFGSAESGLYTFFSPDNWELLLKVLDGCALNGKIWVFAAGTTDVGWTLEIEDRESGASRLYRNELFEPSRTLADSAAFDCDQPPRPDPGPESGW